MHAFSVSSRLVADAARVWDEASVPEGINRELWPIVQMTTPPGFTEIREGRLGRSWILLLGVLPIDYDDLYLEAVEPGSGFRERSVLGSASSWWHDRSIEPLPGGGCRVTDRIRFTPRVPQLGGLQAFLFEATFRWRHHRLRRIFGAPPSTGA